MLGNGLIGTIEAFLSSSPMLLLTDFSDAPRFQLHAPYQQATGDYGSWDARRAFGGVTKQVMQAQDPIAAVQATQLAIKHALAGQPGPVAVLFSHDSLAGSVAPEFAAGAVSDPLLPAAARRRRPTRAQIAAAAERAARGANGRSSSPATACASRRPMTQLRALAETAGLPVATTAAGKGCFPETHPLALGVFGTFGTAAANACLGEADLVLVVGSKLCAERHRLGEPQTARSDAADLYPDRYRADATPRGPSRPSRCCSATPRGSLGQLAKRCARARTGAARPPSGASPATASAHGYFDAPRLCRRRPADPAAAGDRRIDAQPAGGRDRHLRCRREPHHDDAFLPDQGGRRLSAGGRLGADGVRHPGGAGAKLVHPDRPVVAVCGDGGFAMTMNGLMTALEHDIPIIIVVFNNKALGWVLHGGGPVCRRIQRFRPRRDRPRDGLPRHARRGSGGARPGARRGAGGARADRDRCADLARRVVRRHHLAARQRGLAAPALSGNAPGSASPLLQLGRRSCSNHKSLRPRLSRPSAMTAGPDGGSADTFSTLADVCCAAGLTGTNRIVGCAAASLITSASIRSLWPRLTNGLTYCGAISLARWPIAKKPASRMARSASRRQHHLGRRQLGENPSTWLRLRLRRNTGGSRSPTPHRVKTCLDASMATRFKLHRGPPPVCVCDDQTMAQ